METLTTPFAFISTGSVIVRVVPEISISVVGTPFTRIVEEAIRVGIVVPIGKITLTLSIPGRRFPLTPVVNEIL